MKERRPLPPAGLCASCRAAEVLRSARSNFLRCRMADRDPSFARYPLLPVLVCAGHDPIPSGGPPAPARVD